MLPVIRHRIQGASLVQTAVAHAGTRGFSFARCLAMLLGLFVCSVSMAAAQDSAEGDSAGTAAGDADATSDQLYRFRQFHNPNGIGKFYMGREIARVMGFRGARWLNRPQREKQEDVSKMVELLDLEPGMNVADIGAGTGVVTERLARVVGPTGKVYAVDIQDEMLRLLAARMKAQGITNVVPVLGTITDPKLKNGSIDLMLMVDVYHEFSHPHEMVTAMVEGLKPGGRIVLVEYRKEDPRVPIKIIHKMTEKQVKRELLRPEFGLEWVTTHDDLPRQHVIVFRKPADTVK